MIYSSQLLIYLTLALYAAPPFSSCLNILFLYSHILSIIHLTCAYTYVETSFTHICIQHFRSLSLHYIMFTLTLYFTSILVLYLSFFLSVFSFFIPFMDFILTKVIYADNSRRMRARYEYEFLKKRQDVKKREMVKYVDVRYIMLV